MDLTVEQWRVLEPLIGEMRRRRLGRPWHSSREVLSGIVWTLHTRAQWTDLPQSVSAVPDLPPALPMFSCGRIPSSGSWRR